MCSQSKARCQTHVACDGAVLPGGSNLDAAAIANVRAPFGIGDLHRPHNVSVFGSNLGAAIPIPRPRQIACRTRPTVHSQSGCFQSAVQFIPPPAFAMTDASSSFSGKVRLHEHLGGNRAEDGPAVGVSRPPRATSPSHPCPACRRRGSGLPFPRASPRSARPRSATATPRWPHSGAPRARPWSGRSRRP